MFLVVTGCGPRCAPVRGLGHQVGSVRNCPRNRCVVSEHVPGTGAQNGVSVTLRSRSRRRKLRGSTRVRHSAVRILPAQPHSPVILARRETLRKSPDIPCVSSYRTRSLAPTNFRDFRAEKREFRRPVSVRNFPISVFAAPAAPETHLFCTETGSTMPFSTSQTSGSKVLSMSCLAEALFCKPLAIFASERQLTRRLTFFYTEPAANSTMGPASVGRSAKSIPGYQCSSPPPIACSVPSRRRSAGS